MSLTVTGGALITSALQTLQVRSPVEAITAQDATTGLFTLQELIDHWNTQRLIVLTVDRHVYSLVANQGGPALPYLLGPGGDFDTGTQPRPLSIHNAALLLLTSSPPVEIPLSMQTDDAFAVNPIKTLSNSLPTTLYYNPSNPLGTVVLWPIPDVATNQLVLYFDTVTGQVTSLNTPVIFAPGYALALRLSLAAALVPYYSVPLDRAASIQQAAREAVTAIKLANVKMADLALDPALTPDRRGNYNILSDQGG